MALTIGSFKSNACNVACCSASVSFKLNSRIRSNFCCPVVTSAAMAIITSGAALNRREGQFLGGISFEDRPLTEKQDNWLRILLAKHGLPPLVERGAA